MFDSSDLSRFQVKTQKHVAMEETEKYREKVNYNSFFMATVVGTNDMYGIGRVQIRIPALHGTSLREANYISDSSLPWARPR